MSCGCGAVKPVMKSIEVEQESVNDAAFEIDTYGWDHRSKTAKAVSAIEQLRFHYKDSEFTHDQLEKVMDYIHEALQQVVDEQEAERVRKEEEELREQIEREENEQQHAEVIAMLLAAGEEELERAYLNEYRMNQNYDA